VRNVKSDVLLLVWDKFHARHRNSVPATRPASEDADGDQGSDPERGWRRSGPVQLTMSIDFVDQLAAVEGRPVGRVASRQPARIEEAFYWVAPLPIGRSRG
jgi:hypothetical protein